MSGKHDLIVVLRKSPLSTTGAVGSSVASVEVQQRPCGTVKLMVASQNACGGGAVRDSNGPIGLVLNLGVRKDAQQTLAAETLRRNVRGSVQGHENCGQP
jgi:hypothetical protein